MVYMYTLTHMAHRVALTSRPWLAASGTYHGADRSGPTRPWDQSVVAAVKTCWSVSAGPCGTTCLWGSREEGCSCSHLPTASCCVHAHRCGPDAVFVPVLIPVPHGLSCSDPSRLRPVADGRMEQWVPASIKQWPRDTHPYGCAGCTRGRAPPGVTRRPYGRCGAQDHEVLRRA